MQTTQASSSPSAGARTPDTTGLASSGTSPGRPLALYLIGLGPVGRALLRRSSAHPLRLVAASDSSGTLVARDGLDAAVVGRVKEERRSLASTGLAEDLPLELLVALVAADVLVEAGPSACDGSRDAAERADRALAAGSRVVFASKDALANRAHAWQDEIATGRIGWNAALGGTGLRLARELAWLREETVELELVANATSSLVLAELERGAELAAALRRAREAGLCEGEAALDLDGRDAATKLAIVAGAVFGRALPLAEIEREDLRRLDPERLAWRRARGLTTRLVARARRDGGASVRAEELDRRSILNVPPDRVVYAAHLRDGRRRVHLGQGLGPARTADALLADLFAVGGAA